MLHLVENSPLEMLRQLSVHFNAEMTEKLNASKSNFDNDKGKGTMYLFEIFPGLTALSFDLYLRNDLHLTISSGANASYYFGYLMEGAQQQKFSNEDRFRDIQCGQKFIIIGNQEAETEYNIKGKESFKCCYLIINFTAIKTGSPEDSRWLQTDLKELFDNSEMKTPYSYFGKIDLRVGAYAKIILDNRRTDLVGRLLMEGAILNMLGAHIQGHDRNVNMNSIEPKLSKKELNKLTNLGDYIRNNISERLTIDTISSHLMMSPKKLQSGIKFLYGYSVNQYISNYKLEEARELIHTTEVSISEICYLTGYSSRSYFSRIFYNRFGVLPSNYKKSFNENGLIYEISYRSIANKQISDADLSQIVSIARSKNPDFQITGSLISHNNIFFQLIEGPKAHVERLFENIRKDPRHSKLVVLWKGYKAVKDFTDWDMAFITDRWTVDMEVDGDMKQLDLSPVLRDVHETSLASEMLWKKVRNILKAGRTLN